MSVLNSSAMCFSCWCRFWVEVVLAPDSAAHAEAADLLSALTSDAPACLHEYVQRLDPFPPEEAALEGPRILHEALAEDVPFDERLARFVERVPHALAHQRRTTIASLLGELSQHRDKLHSSRDKVEV